MTSGIRYTREDVVYILGQYGCGLKGDYVKAKKDITIICRCGREWDSPLDRFMTQNPHKCCPQCSQEIKGIGLRKEFNQVIEDAYGVGYTYVSGEYETQESKLHFVDNYGYKYYASFSSVRNIINGHSKSLKAFSNDNPYTLENIVLWLSLNRPEFTLTGGCYTTRDNTLEVLCNTCGNKFYSSWNNLRDRKYCPECERNAMSERFLLELNEISDRFAYYGYYLYGEQNYQGWESKLIVTDDIGYFYLTTPSGFNKERNRRLCVFGKGNPYTNYNINLWVSINNKDYTFVDGEYEDAKTRNLIFQCHKCSMKWKTNWNSIENGYGCPRCNNFSKGEDLIERFLIENGIKNYIREYWFPDCKRLRKPLEFDFAIFDEDNNLYMLCEYDGEHHHFPVDFAGKGEEWAKEQFELSKVKDEIKNQYCYDNGIYLLRVPYWDRERIPEILTKELNLN
jgi:hypothetical protein